MKQLTVIVFAAVTVVFAACNNSGNSSAEKKDSTMHDKMAMDSMNNNADENVNAPVVKASFANVNSDVAAHINELTNHYFHIKHALTKDDAAEAKNGATMLLQVIAQFDNSLLPAGQKEEYSKHIVAIKEQALAITKGADVETERMHFSELSAHTYTLVKAFGAGKKVYYDHCPMTLNNKCAIWRS